MKMYDVIGGTIKILGNKRARRYRFLFSGLESLWLHNDTAEYYHMCWLPRIRLLSFGVEMVLYLVGCE